MSRFFFKLLVTLSERFRDGFLSPQSRAIQWSKSRLSSLPCVRDTEQTEHGKSS